MSLVSIKKQVDGSVEHICNKITETIPSIGFGILTRIDFDKKIQEKLNEGINKTVILGACHPKLALEAYRQTTDVTLLMPCNIVVREIDDGTVLVEAIRPSQMLQMLNEVSPSDTLHEAEQNLENFILAL
ncbi:MAG: DUF302 domain-containing protein [Bdellovibrionales bacterium]|nr:DUF302 domain-containing protein [Bdellovibrionales bacterium]